MSRRRKVALIATGAVLLLLVALSFSSFEVRDDVVIDAPPEAVWAVLIDLPRYAEWNHQLSWKGGKVALGEVLQLRLAADGADPYDFAPTVTELDAPVRFSWLGRTGLPRVFDGAHTFELEPLPDGKTRLVNSERYSGVLAPMMERLPMMAGAQAGFATMNEEFKRRVEGRR